MRLTMVDSRWSTLLRGALVTLSAILGLSLVTLILSGIWGRNMTKLRYAPESGKPSKALLVFYTGTMPFLTLFWAALDIGLASVASLSPVHALISSIVLLCGWLAQFNIWMQCEMTAPGINESFDESMWCPNAQISDHAATLRYTTEYIEGARAYVGLVVAVGAFVYMVLAAVSVARNRKAARTSLPFRKDPEAELLSTPP